VVIGFAVVATPAKITFSLNCGHEEGEHSNCGEFVKDITGAPTGKLNLPTPVRPGYRFNGWTSSLTGTEFVTKVNKKKMNLYAQWTQIDVVASLYVSGMYLRDVTIPVLGSTQQDTGTLGGASSGLVLTANEMERFGIAAGGFTGWRYFDEKKDEIEIRWNGSKWDSFKNGSYSSLSPTNPFNPSGYNKDITSGYRVALNAVVATYRNITIEYYGVGGDGNRISSTTSPITQRLGSSYTVNFPYTPTNGATLVGWRLQDESNIFTNCQSPTSCTNSNCAGHLRLDQSIWDQCTGTILKFYAVTVATPTVGGRTHTVYDKLYEKGRYVYSQVGEPVPHTIHSVTINNKTAAANEEVRFDFAGGYGGSLKTTTTRSMNAAGTAIESITPIDVTNGKKSYPGVTSSESWRNEFPQTDGTLRLPLANSFAIAGMVFDGWQEMWKKSDGKIYPGELHPAGLIYRLPFGMKQGDLSFTAVWKSTNELIAFNLAGGEATWGANAYYGIPGRTITLPTPKRYGYDFDGWNEAGARDDGGVLTTTHEAGESFVLKDQKIRLTAKWRPKKIAVISFNVPGQSVLPKTDVSFGTVLELERPNIGFIGWEFIYDTIVRQNLRFTFGAPFINKIYIEINKDFCTDYTNSQDDKRLFNPTVGEPNLFARAFQS